MSVVGFDIGNMNTVIAVARNRGIDVICNEVSNRATPSLVSFGPKSRHIGEQAKTQEISNFKNTLGSLKRLLGPVTPEQLEIERTFSGSDLVLGVDGTVTANVEFLNEPRSFTYTQLFAMFLSKLKEITEAELKTHVCDVVISVPVYFGDAQRRSVVDAAKIAGLNVLRLLNDVTAAGLQWGISRELNETPKYVAFVDIGNSDMTVQISSFTKGKMQVKSCAYDKNFGGRNLDNALLDYFVEEFKEKYKINVRENPKALFRLRSACERVKKVLSANLQSPLNVECLMNDKDVSSMVERPQFEELIAPLVNNIDSVLEEALNQAGVKKEDIEYIELIGGTTRVPLVKSKITGFFGKDPSTTLNQDECVSKGCAFQCAILSPVFKTREFKIEDVVVNPIKFIYPLTANSNEMKELVAFPTQSCVPSTKLLTFNRSETFDIEAYQSNRWIGKYTIKVPITPLEGADNTIKVKVRLNPDSCLDVPSAHVLIDAPIVEMKVDEKDENKLADSKEDVGDTKSSDNLPGENMDLDETSPNTIKKVKKDIPVYTANSSLEEKSVNDFKSAELDMFAADKLVLETDNARNSLEEYIYDIRSKVETSHSEFCKESEREKLIKLCAETEDWLYGDGEEATKSIYMEKLDVLKKIGNPICERFSASFESSVTASESVTESKNGDAELMNEDSPDVEKETPEK